MHSGFLEQYDSVRNDVWDIVRERLKTFPQTKTLFFCGHSMGGALTLLSTLDFSVNGFFSDIEGMCLFFIFSCLTEKSGIR